MDKNGQIVVSQHLSSDGEKMKDAEQVLHKLENKLHLTSSLSNNNLTVIQL